MNNTVVNVAGSFDYAYIYKDHLGNNRLTYGVDRTTGVMKIMEENHYYPYGFKHASYNTERNEFQKQESTVVLKGPTNPDPGNTDAAVYPFKYRYNGKEYQDEMGLNMYDMDMRQYDPAIGRWVVPDPVVHHDMSPYNAFDNNPVFWTDPSGADSQTGQTDSNGSKRFDALGQYIPPLDRFVNNYPFDNSDEDRYRRNVTKNEPGSSDTPKDTDPPKNNEGGTSFFDILSQFFYKSSGAEKFDTDMKTALDGGSSIGVAGWQAFVLNKQNELVLGNGSGSPYASTSRLAKFTVNPSKFDYFFGRVVNGSEHNIARSAQNLKGLTTLGIRTESQLINVFSQALEQGVIISTKTNQYGTNVTRSIQIGNKGAINVGFFYQGGNMSVTPSISTIIPKIY